MNTLVVETYACSRCGTEVEDWDPALGKPLCQRCWDVLDNFEVAHREALAASRRRYYEEHKAEIAASRRRYNEEHKAERAAWKRRYNEEHKAERAAWKRRYYEEHKYGRQN